MPLEYRADHVGCLLRPVSPRKIAIMPAVNSTGTTAISNWTLAGLSPNKHHR